MKAEPEIFTWSCVYALSHPRQHGILKIGMTRRGVEGVYERARRYTDGRWNVRAMIPCEDHLVAIAERRVHQALDSFWLDPNVVLTTRKELFVIDSGRGCRAIREVVAALRAEHDCHAEIKLMRVGAYGVSASFHALPGRDDLDAINGAIDGIAEARFFDARLMAESIGSEKIERALQFLRDLKDAMEA